MPPYAGIFVQLTFLNTLVEILLNSNETLNRASGKIRKFQIIISVAQLLILIVSYIVLEITRQFHFDCSSYKCHLSVDFHSTHYSKQTLYRNNIRIFFQTYVKRSYDCNFVSQLLYALHSYPVWNKVGFVCSGQVSYPP